MRDKNRTYEFCNEFARLWSKKFPDLRFGQLMLNFLYWCGNEKGRDPFFPEEDEMIKLFKEYCGEK